MTTPERRVSNCAVLIETGLLIQLVSLLWSHPLAFVVYLVVGTPLVAAGALLFLWSLIQAPWGE